MREEIERLIDYVKESDNIVFFGGAGASTESGIPDFRSKDGLYNQHDVQFDQYSPEYLLSHDCLYRKPKVFYEFYRQKMDTRDIKPNKTHEVLAKLEKQGKLKAVVTQNIDGLHQKAGSEKVYEIHGTTAKNYCSACGKRYPADYIFTSKEPIPLCTDCGGQIRPEVVFYQESLPEHAVYQSIRAIEAADLLIVGGTSLTVYPAASYIEYFQGKHLVVINRDALSIRINPERDVVIQGSLGEVFGELEKALWNE